MAKTARLDELLRDTQEIESLSLSQSAFRGLADAILRCQCFMILTGRF